MKKHLLLLLPVCWLCSCVSSLYSLSVDEKEYVFRKELLGTWKEKDNDTEYIIQHTGNKNYSITVIDKETKPNTGNTKYDTNRFAGFMIELNNEYFFDCYTDKDQIQQCCRENNTSTLLTTHAIFKLHSISQNQLRLSALDFESLKNVIDKKTIAIRHEKFSKDHILLTEKPEVLTLKVLLNKKATLFGEITVFNRIQ